VSSIQKWHVGKLVLLWGVCAMGFWLVTEGGSDTFVWAALAYLVFCVAVTWVLLSGREGKR